MIEELPAGFIAFKNTVVVRCNGGTAFVFNSTAGHAHVLGFEDHGNILCLENGFQGFGNLAGQPLLHLRSLRVVGHEPVDLTQPDE